MATSISYCGRSSYLPSCGLSYLATQLEAFVQVGACFPCCQSHGVEAASTILLPVIVIVKDNANIKTKTFRGLFIIIAGYPGRDRNRRDNRAQTLIRIWRYSPNSNQAPEESVE